MAKLDHLGWVAGFTFSSYGIHIGIRANDPRAIELARECLPPGWKPGKSARVERLYSIILGGPSANPNVRKFNLLYKDHARSTRSRDELTVFDDLERELSALISVGARRRLFIHAGVVALNGKAIVIPGKTLAGKTTLVAEFVKAGATYYSDEYAVFDAHGRVHPYARPLGIRENGVGDKAKRYPVTALGGTSGDKALPVGLVLVTEYREEGKWSPRKLSPGQGAMALLANTVAARVKPEVMLPTLRQVVEHATILKSSRGEASEVVDSVLKMDLAGRD